MNNESFVLYESVFKQVEILEKRLGKEVAFDYIKAIMEFGLYAVVPEEESSVWLYGFEQSITSIGAAKQRYNAAVENGKKGGRKKIELNQEEVMQKKEELKTWKAVAEYYGIEADTLRKIRNQWEKTEKPKNLNDNVNVNVNVNENVIEDKLLLRNNLSSTSAKGAGINKPVEVYTNIPEEAKRKAMLFDLEREIQMAKAN